MVLRQVVVHGLALCLAADTERPLAHQTSDLRVDLILIVVVRTRASPGAAANPARGSSHADPRICIC